MKIISFGQLSVSNTFPFIVSLLYVTRNYILIEIKDNDEIDNYWLQVPWFFTLLKFIGETLNGILDLISYCLIKTRKRIVIEKNNRKTMIAILPARQAHQSTSIILLYIYLSSAIEGLSLSVILVRSHLYDETLDFSFQMIIFSLFFIIILSYLILKHPIYFHQQVSCLIVAVGIILFLISKISANKTGINSLMINFGIYFTTYFLLSIREVLHKWLMEMQQIRSVRIIFIEGVFGIINSTLGIVIYDKYFNAHMTLSDCFIKLFGSNLLIILLFSFYIICCFGNELFSIYTKYVYSPTMMAIAYSFTLILWEGVLLIKYKDLDKGTLWYLVPGYLFLFFGCLLYNEIIIIYIPRSMSVNTKKEIMIRCDKDMLNDNSWYSSFNETNSND